MIDRILAFIVFSSFLTVQAQEPTPEQMVMINEIFAGFKSAIAPGHPTQRPVFGKDHGCVRGTFEVNSALPANLRVGVFKGTRYDAWIRFANDGAAAKIDGEPAARGMAIKLVGVPGRKILEGFEDALTQDFVMQNHPIFFVDDLKGFRDLIVMPPAEFNRAHPETQPIFDKMDQNKLADPLDGTYWTPVPYKLGAQPVKYMVEPCSPAPAPETKPMTGDNFLRQNLIDHLKSPGPSVCFAFKIQLQTNEIEMPVDKATVLWDPKQSNFIEVAKVLIPRNQNVDVPQRKQLCENISMTPWHSLPEHAPLGSVNLARKFVYKNIAKHRRDRNGIPRDQQKEPTSIGPNE